MTTTLYTEINDSLFAKLAKIKLLVCDVDGVFSDGRIYLGNDGEELKAFHTRDGYGVKALVSNGVNVAVITGRRSAIVENRMKALNVAHIIQGEENKADALSDLMKRLELNTDEVAAVGDDMPDTGMYKHVSVKIAVADAHPYVMLNYLGKPRDVMTLAHELGHGVHQRLAAGQGELLSSTPLTLAETASVFGEMLTFRKMLAQAKSDAERKVMLAGKVEDMINTVVRQIAFYDFECKLHAARAESELTPDDINALWMSVQAESLGPVFDYMDGYETFWAYIPHFVHSPFYVYAYAFGDGLVNALYAVYEEGGDDFQEKYFDMLKAGGSKHHKDLLAPFGLDASDPAFWGRGLSVIEGFIDELEQM